MIHEQREQLAARVRASSGSEQIRYREEEIGEASHEGTYPREALDLKPIKYIPD